MSAREFFELVASALRDRDRAAAILAEEESRAGCTSPSSGRRAPGAGDPTFRAVERLAAQRARCGELSRRAEGLLARAEALLALLPDPELEAAVRLRYLHGRAPESVAAYVGCSRRKVFYLLKRAFSWLDANAGGL